MHLHRKRTHPSGLWPFMVLWLSIMPAPAAVGGIVGGKTAGTAVASGPSPAVAIEQSPYNDAVVYSIADGDCAISWTVYTTELNRGVVKHWAHCPRPLVKQLPLLTAILGEFLSGDPNARFFHTLFWGGLVPEQGPASQELSLRLALAAARSPGWNADRGKPAAGGLNRFVRDLANSEPIYPELRTLFGRFHRSISISGMEKVRVLEARRLPFSDELKKQGVAAKDKLPFDCMVWFSVAETPR